jgi:hypothetical protein
VLNDERTKRMLQGIKRTQSFTTKRVRLPVTTSLLRQFTQHLNLLNAGDRLLWAAMWAATTGLLRISEFTVRFHAHRDRMLTMSHLSFHSAINSPITNNVRNNRQSALFMSIRLDTSKTDPFRMGVDIIISNKCAISAMCNYLDHCGFDHISSAPLYSIDGHTPMTSYQVTSALRVLIANVGLDPAMYASHSFRRGGATSLSEQGVPATTIQALGRWKSASYALYVHTPLATIIQAAASL